MNVVGLKMSLFYYTYIYSYCMLEFWLISGLKSAFLQVSNIGRTLCSKANFCSTDQQKLLAIHGDVLS
jgi:hypothetical protein